MYRFFAGISSLMMLWTARNSCAKSSAACAASEIRSVAVCSCAACSRSLAESAEARRAEGGRRLGDISADQELPPRRRDPGLHYLFYLYEGRCRSPESLHAPSRKDAQCCSICPSP